jgi:hypothetical protein
MNPLTFVNALAIKGALESILTETVLSANHAARNPLGPDFHRSLIAMPGYRAVPCSANGREVMASACLSGIPSCMKIVHQ